MRLYNIKKPKNNIETRKKGIGIHRNEYKIVNMI